MIDLRSNRCTIRGRTFWDPIFSTRSINPLMLKSHTWISSLRVRHIFDLLSKNFDLSSPDGHAYCLGSLKQDRWYLYTMHRQPKKTRTANRNPVGSFPSFNLTPNQLQDHTLEILMNDLDSDILPVFTKDVCEDGRECFEVGISHIRMIDKAHDFRSPE